jgi:hypothetical protein
MQWDSMILLMWSTPNPREGGLTLDPDMMPKEIKDWVQAEGLLDAIVGGPDEQFIQPRLIPQQNSDGIFRLELLHPEYEGAFTFKHQVARVIQVTLPLNPKVHAKATEYVEGQGSPITRQNSTKVES